MPPRTSAAAERAAEGSSSGTWLTFGFLPVTMAGFFGSVWIWSHAAPRKSGAAGSKNPDRLLSASPSP